MAGQDDKDFVRQLKDLEGLTRETFERLGGAPEFGHEDVKSQEVRTEPDQLFTPVEGAANPQQQQAAPSVRFIETPSGPGQNPFGGDTQQEQIALIIRLLEDMPERIADALGVNT